MQQELENLTKNTLKVWQPWASSTLTAEDAWEIIENIAGYFNILAEWHAADQELSSHADLQVTLSGDEKEVA